MRRYQFLYILTGFLVFSIIVFCFCIVFIEIPKANIRFADTLIGLLVGTVLGSIIGFFYGGQNDNKKDNNNAGG